MTQIEKGVPIPKSLTARGLALDTLPWDEMEIGDSFIYENASAGGLKKAAARHGIKIVIRAIPERSGRTASGGFVAAAFRVWRVE